VHPLAATWIANLSKSRRDVNHQFQRASMRFEVTGNTVVLNFEGVNASSKNEGNTLNFQADDHAHPLPQDPGVTVTSTLGPRTLTSAATKSGTVVGRSTYEVSEDGRTMSATVSGVDGSGRPFDQVIVFDRLME